MNKLISDYLSKKHSRSNSRPQKNYSSSTSYTFLSYTIDSYSSYSNNFFPRNILKDSPTDVSSKWMVEFRQKDQFLMIKLDKPSILKQITFGKFKDPSSLAEFKLYSGMDRTNMIEILHSNLRNEKEYETIQIPENNKQKNITSLYLKLIPIKPASEIYKISIWFIRLIGIDNQEIIEGCIKSNKEKQEIEQKRIWLKLTRELPFNTVNFEEKNLKNFISSFEDNNITQLYECIMKGDYFQANEIIEKFNENNRLKCLNHSYKVRYKREDFLVNEVRKVFDGIEYELGYNLKKKSFKSFLDKLSKEKELEIEIQKIFMKSPPFLEESIESGFEKKMEVENLYDLDSNFSEPNVFSNFIDMQPSSILPSFDDFNVLGPISNQSRGDKVNISSFPSKRYNHSMAIDTVNDIIYLLGGNDEKKDLGDFWSYDIKSSKWTLLSENTKKEGGPGPLSCHCIVYDNSNHILYCLGNYYNRVRITICVSSRYLYEYDTKNHSWSMKRVDIQIKDGERQPIENSVCGQKMCLDEKNRILYVFGGKTNTNSMSPYFGLWKLDLINYSWVHLYDEIGKNFGISLRSRVGHVMVFDEKENQLIILGGSRNVKNKNCYNICDIISYDIGSGTIQEISHDFTKMKNFPEAISSMYYCYDKENRNIILFGGKTISENNEMTYNSLYIYDIERKEFNNTITNYDPISLDYLEEISSDNYEGYQKPLLNNKEELTLEKKDSKGKPLPRFGHCIVYSQNSKKGFIFGGKSSHLLQKKNPIGDFWSFTIEQDHQSKTLNEVKYKLFTSYYNELCAEGKYDTAMTLLRNVLMKDFPEYESQTKKLASQIIYNPLLPDIRQARNLLFQTISMYIKEE